MSPSWLMWLVETNYHDIKSKKSMRFPYEFNVCLLVNSGLNFNFKKCLNNAANHENLDLSHFFKNWTNHIFKKICFKNYSIF